MYQYDFVSLDFEWGLTGRTLESHREIITASAEKGWRFTGMIPTRILPDGMIVQLDLVFEKTME